MTELLPEGTYPFDLVGPVARPPAPVRASVLTLAQDARRQLLGAEGLEAQRYGFTMPDWRLAGAIAQLREEADTANPARDKASDGTIGDPRHAGRGPGSPEWDDSDHNPWLVVASLGVVRAADIDTSDLDLPTAFEAARRKAHAGELPQLVGGGYLILNGRITSPSFDGWRQYKGANPHILAGHVSVSRELARFDDRRPWGIFGGPTPRPTPPSPAPPTPRPTPPPGPGWTGPDLRGTGLALRGEQGANGPRVQRLQAFWRTTYPLYAKALEVDGWWGPRTTAVCREFAQRTGIRSADGRNIGEQVARKLYLAGFRG